MHNIEPYYNWRHLYVASEDEKSPFYNREYSELYFENDIYGYYIHPQWDEIGSPTLFLKILFCDYEEGYAIIEFLGEWNDEINNDIMFLKRDIADALIQEGINKFILIGENILNAFPNEDGYYEEWFDDIDDGWIALVNFRDHVMAEFSNSGLDCYFVLGGTLNQIDWRTRMPSNVYKNVSDLVQKRIGF